MTMTIADLLAADFHLSPSNIPVAPLDAAGAYPRGDLVVYRAGARAEFLSADALFALGTEQHDLVPHLDRVIHTEDAGVHRNPSQQRAPATPDQGLGPPGQRPSVALRVPHGHRRREHRLPRPVGQPVRHPVSAS